MATQQQYDMSFEQRGDLQAELEDANRMVKALKLEISEIKARGLDERHVAKFRSLEKFWSSMVNFRLGEPKDKKRLNKVIARYQKVITRETTG